MDKIEAYALLFTDSFFSNLVFSISDELVLYTMRYFGNYDNAAILAVVIAANILAICANYLLGIVLGNILSKPASTLKFIESLSKYNIIFLPLVVIPFCGKFIPVMAGLFRINFVKTLVVTTLAKACYYYISLLVL